MTARAGGSPPETVRVVLQGLPLALADRAEEHHADLMREFALLSLDSGSSSEIPGRLLALVHELEARYASASEAAERGRAEARARGDATTDLVVHVPPMAGESMRGLLELLEEADEYCRRGHHLLTTAADPDVAAYRRWYLGQVVDQAAGLPPVPWPGGPGEG